MVKRSHPAHSLVEWRERILYITSSRTVTDHLQRPGQIQQVRQGIGEEPIRSEFVTISHHRDRYQTGRMVLGFWFSAIVSCVNKRFEGKPVPRRAQQWQDTLSVFPV